MATAEDLAFRTSLSSPLHTAKPFVVPGSKPPSSSSSLETLVIAYHSKPPHTCL